MRVIVGRAPRTATVEDVAALKDSGAKAAEAVGGVFVLIPEGCSLKEIRESKPVKVRAQRPLCRPA